MLAESEWQGGLAKVPLFFFDDMHGLPTPKSNPNPLLHLMLTKS